jgi:hypothetical protein
MSAPIEMAGEDVVAYLQGGNSLRDGRLVSLVAHAVEEAPVLDLTFRTVHGSPERIVHLRLGDIREWAVYDDDGGLLDDIAFVKCLWLPAGEFYLSLDRYDERDGSPSDKDNAFFRSSSVQMTVRYQG